MSMTKRQLMLISDTQQPTLACFPLVVRAIAILIPTNTEVYQHLLDPLSDNLAKTYARLESTLSKFYGRTVGMLRIHPGYTRKFPELRSTVHVFDFIVRNASRPATALMLRGGGISLYEAAYTRSVLEEFRKGNDLPFVIKHRFVRQMLHLPTARGIDVAKAARYIPNAGDQ